MADFFDVTRLQVDLDRKTILQLVETRGVERSGRVIVRQSLLGSGEDPDRATANLLQILGQAVEVQDQTWLGGNILPDFVDDEDDVLLP